MSDWSDNKEDLVILIVLGVFQVCFWTGAWYILSTLYCWVMK